MQGDPKKEISSLITQIKQIIIACKLPKEQKAAVEKTLNNLQAAKPNPFSVLRHLAFKQERQSLIQLAQKQGHSALVTALSAPLPDDAALSSLSLDEKQRIFTLFKPNRTEPERKHMSLEASTTEALAIAADQGDVPQVEMILSILPTDREIDALALAFGLAGRNGWIKIAALLLPRLSNRQLTMPLEETGLTVLHFVARRQQSRIVKLMMPRLSPDSINTQDKQGHTALHLAAEVGDFKTVALLLSAGLSAEQINLSDHYGTTALQIAAQNRHKKTVELLLNRLSSTHLIVQNKDGNTALHFGIISGEYKIVKQLLDKLTPDEANIANHDGVTPMHAAMYVPRLNILEALLEKLSPEHMSRQAPNGITPLHTATFQKNEQTVRRMLLKLTPDQINIPDSDGISAFHLAISTRRATMVKLYLERLSQSELGQADIDGNTAIHMAAYDGNMQIIDLLMPRLSTRQLCARNKEGFTPFHFAARSGYVEVIKRLILRLPKRQLSAKTALGRNALHLGCLQAIPLLLMALPNELINEPDQHDKTPLQLAVFRGQDQIVELLLNALSPEQINGFRKRGDFLILIAVRCGYDHIVELLLNKLPAESLGSNDLAGANALHVVLSSTPLSRKQPILDLLLRSKKIDVNATHFGNTPLHQAVLTRDVDTVKRLLREESIGLSIRNKQGNTALDLALTLLPQNPEIISCLTQAESHQKKVAHPRLVDLTEIKSITRGLNQSGLFAQIGREQQASITLTRPDPIEPDLKHSFKAKSTRYALTGSLFATRQNNPTPMSLAPTEPYYYQVQLPPLDVKYGNSFYVHIREDVVQAAEKKQIWNPLEMILERGARFTPADDHRQGIKKLANGTYELAVRGKGARGDARLCGDGFKYEDVPGIGDAWVLTFNRLANNHKKVRKGAKKKLESVTTAETGSDTSQLALCN